ncbi:DUF3310 domain-containing protein [Streptomyces sp. NPDC006355]|uniref:DUF3310 domain-containing protein n=1 Tax=Streptomyces sp. NPDC006355 TaxID=3156758 RepID=UPI0033BF0EEE
MSKFQVGDRVVVIGIPGENGKRGEVTDPERNDSWPVEIKFDNDEHLGLCTEDELEFEHIYDALSAKPDVQIFGDEESGKFVIDMSESQGIFLDAVKVDSRDDDVVNHPSHYTSHPSGIECIQVTEHMNFNLGNATKYVWRAGLKSNNPIQDLQKARWYIEREIQRLGGSV